MSQQICISYWNHKICWKATTICLFSIFENLMSNSIQVPSNFFGRTKFFPTSWSVVFSQVWQRSIFKFCVYKLAEAVSFQKFKWEFIITSAEREVKDSRLSGMYQSRYFQDKIGHAKSVGFRFYSAIWQSESRISSRCLEITSISLIYSLILLFWLLHKNVLSLLSVT